MLDFLSNLLAIFIPHRDIVIDGELYLRRFFLTPRGWKKRLFLHHIRKSDAGRWLHDHPWDFTSFALWGWYTETVPAPGYDPASRWTIRHHHWLRPHRYKAEDIHQVIVPEGKQAVTLCIVGPTRRVWGFWTREGWVDWRTHLKVPEGAPTPREDVVHARVYAP